MKNLFVEYDKYSESLGYQGFKEWNRRVSCIKSAIYFR